MPRLALLVAPALLLAAPAARAQSGAPLERPVRTAVVVGASIARMTEVEDAEPRNGLVLGGQLTIRVNALFAFQPELLYVQKGLEGALDFGGTPVDLAYRSDYLEVPLLARLSLGGRTVRPFVLAGPSLAFSVACHVDGEVDGDTETIACADADAEPAAVDLGLVAGGGLELPIGMNALTVGARYTAGLLEALDGTGSRHRTVAITVGFTF